MEEFTAVRGQAPLMLGVVWTFQLIAFILVGLRLYTRLVVIHNYGMDDHFFNLSVFCLLVYVILISIATRYGLGQPINEITPHQMTRALLLVNVGQTIIFVAVIAVKISIACFLLRIVGTFTAKQYAIIVPVTAMSLIVFICAWVLWFSCTPMNYIWDVSIPGGRCDLVKQFWASIIPGVSVVLVELCSAACSIARLMHALRTAQETDDSVFLVMIVEGLIWHAADHTTQLLCIGITVCRPLYKDWLYRVADRIEGPFTTAETTKGSGYGAQKGADAIALRSIGGGMINSATDDPGRRRGRPTHASKKPGAALRRDLVLQSIDVPENNSVLKNNNTEFSTLPPVETRPRFERALFPWATSRKN
ncbi:hypothetical protein KVR01_010542 [Diaporthe batatas]|uniref:uncharacterized protein n=1 Tax=Diaporthe batatas TaxID=748121 RepID=UPI001D0403A1|nr:uncharacterized protein KVR01_010542 [Diaporthe batatas]KAG8159905.1 hypothetical protein KVR01_010542 [Diaporthe batatas]